MSCSNETCILAAGTTVADNLANYKSQYAYMIKYRTIPPGVNTTLNYDKYLAVVTARLLALQAKTKGFICESTGSCECTKMKFFYASYVGADDGAFLPASTVCTQKLS